MSDTTNEDRARDLEQRIAAVQKQLGGVEEQLRGAIRNNRAMHFMPIAMARQVAADPSSFDAAAVARDAFVLADAFEEASKDG
jgi:hypothetical protein